MGNQQRNARHPVQFLKTEYIRIGSYQKKLSEFPEKERELWRVFDQASFEREPAAEGVDSNEVLHLLDSPAYFELFSLPYRDPMTNTSLRERFGIAPQNSAMASRIIGDTVKEGLVRPQDKAANRKFMKYLPFWG